MGRNVMGDVVCSLHRKWWAPDRNARDLM